MTPRTTTVALGLMVVAAACSSAGQAQPASLGSEPVVTTATSQPDTSSPPDTTVGTLPPDPTVPSETIDAPVGPARLRPFMAMSVPQSRYPEIAAVEAAVGQRLDLIRWFQRWDDDLRDPGMTRAMAEGRRVHLSVRPSGGNGRIVAWRDLAEAEPGTTVHDELIAWVDRMVALPPGSYVTLNHEPETVESRPNGSAEEFRAMWVRWNDLLDERGGGDLRTVWVMTGGAFDGPVADTWYPGDDAVDIVGVDPYNWYTCQGTERPWVSFADLLAAPLAFAEAHDKPLAVPETASVEDPERPGRKAEWIRDAAAFVADPSVASRLEFVSWFDVTAPGGTYPDCVWDHDSSASSAEAFRELVRTLGDG